MAIPYLYIPFIFLQIYSMGIRVNQYGLTTSRYMAFVLIIYEVIIIALSIIKKGKHLREIIVATFALSVIVMITPFNYEAVPALSQKKIVESYIAKGVEFDSLSDTDKKKFAGAYQYIDDKEGYEVEGLTQVQKEVLSSYNTYSYSYNSESSSVNETVYISLDKRLNNVDISKYNKIYDLPYVYNNDRLELEYSIDDGNNSYVRIDMTEFANQIIEAHKTSEATAQRVFEEIPVVKVDDNRDLYITRFSSSYKQLEGEPEYVRIEGYILEK